MSNVRLCIPQKILFLIFETKCGLVILYFFEVKIDLFSNKIHTIVVARVLKFKLIDNLRLFPVLYNGTSPSASIKF